MRIAFIRSGTVWPVIFEPRTKIGALAAHLLTNTRRIHQGQVGRQVRRAAAGFNKSPEPTAVGALGSPQEPSIRHATSRRWLSFLRYGNKCAGKFLRRKDHARIRITRTPT